MGVIPSPTAGIGTGSKKPEDKVTVVAKMFNIQKTVYLTSKSYRRYKGI
jgi:hypothetical protein